MTKEEAIREELVLGKNEGMLADLVRAAPNLRLGWLTAVADGAPLDEAQIDVLWDALNLDDSALEDKPDPEAPSEQDGVRSWVVEYVDGVEGPSLSLSPTAKSSGTRIAGPKPWGGGKVVRSWAVNPEDIFEALGYKQGEAKVLANAVEGYRKIAEEKYPALYPPARGDFLPGVSGQADGSRAIPTKGEQNEY